MGDQIEALELRMERREKELISEIEQAKAAAVIERSRLEALHAQVTAAHSVLNWLCLCGLHPVFINIGDVTSVVCARHLSYLWSYQLTVQECREKDDQLLRFQTELTQLVNALRHWKHKSQISVVADTSVGAPVLV
jgi:hypothetical protein